MPATYIPPVQAGAQERFAEVLPYVRASARRAFKRVPCRESRADLCQEAEALAWKRFIQAESKGKDPREFRVVFARRVCAAIWTGHRCARSERRHDPFGIQHQMATGGTPLYLGCPRRSYLQQLVVDLVDARQENPADVAVVSLDTRSWLAQLTERNRQLVEGMLLGERTDGLAGQVGLTAGRVSQLRRQLVDDWHAFQGDE